MSPLVQVGLIAAAASGGVGLAGVLALRALRRRSLRLSLLLLGAVPVLAMVAGMIATAEAMFLSAHDLEVALIVSAVAGVVALASGWLLWRQVAAGSRALRQAARSLGDGAVPAAPDAPLSTELAALSAELAATSAKLTTSREREQALEHSRRELVAWVSHDLRTPLAGLRAMTEALEDGVAEDPARYHRQLRVEVDRLAGMVDDLFELSRIQSGTLRLTLDRVALGDLVSDALASTETLAGARGVRLRGEAVGSPLVRADARELSRVLTNLLVNAIRHTPADGAVHVLARPTDGGAVLQVSDGCGGIPEADLDRVFDLAWRGTHARTPGPGSGAGLGLAIVRGIVEAHHGQVTVANTDRGCCFEVRLPVAIGEP